MPRKKQVQDEQLNPAPTVAPQASAVDVLAEALVKAINIAKPMEKKTAFSRVPKTPWTPKDGSPKLKLKRQTHQHGILIDPDYLTNEEISLLNKVRPGLYYDGYVKVLRRKDRGIDISYPVKTAAQRLKLINQYGIRNLKELLEGCITQAENPVKKDQVDADGDLY